MVHVWLALAVLFAILGFKNKYIQRTAYVILFLFAALRFMYGNDYYNYYRWFNHIHAGGESGFKTEVLYNLLNRYLPSFPVLVALSSALLILVVYRLITKNLPTRYAWIGICIFVISPALFLMNLSALRQSMATCFFVIAINCACRKKYLWYLVMVIVAALLHKSAILLLPFCLIANDKPVKNWVCWVILLGTAFLLMTSGVLLKLVVWVAEWFNDKNYIYMAEQDMQNSIRATLLTSVFYFYVLFNLPKLKGRALVYAKIYVVSPLLGVLAREISMLTRLQMYFDIFAIVTLPSIFMAVQSKGPVIVNRRNVLLTFWDCINKYAMPVLIVAIYLLRYYSFFTNPEWKAFFTYRTIFLLL